jgi:hypothetical protein
MTEHHEPFDPAVAKALRALTGPPTAGELAREADVVPAIASIVTGGGGTVLSLVRKLSQRSAAAAVGVVVAVGATGAAAATGSVDSLLSFAVDRQDPQLVVAGPDEEPGDEPIEAPEQQEPGGQPGDPVGEPAEEPAEVPGKPDPETREGEATEQDQDERSMEPVADNEHVPACPEDVRNHGEYVSTVARWAAGAPDDQLQGMSRGYWVSRAARSDCGKPATDDDPAADEEEEEGSETDGEVSTASSDDTAGSPGASGDQGSRPAHAGPPARTGPPAHAGRPEAPAAAQRPTHAGRPSHAGPQAEPGRGQGGGGSGQGPSARPGG